ncbi:hypothetical protein YPPY100_0642, partial [Yersinia pestis PY-100]
MRPVGVV